MPLDDVIKFYNNNGILSGEKGVEVLGNKFGINWNKVIEPFKGVSIDYSITEPAKWGISGIGLAVLLWLIFKKVKSKSDKKTAIKKTARYALRATRAVNKRGTDQQKKATKKIVASWLKAYKKIQGTD